MNTATSHRLEKTLVCTLLASIALPLLLGGLLRLPPVANRAPPWLLNRTLGGIQAKQAPVDLSRASLFSSHYQQAAARMYDENFFGREPMIRLVNELYLRVFHTASSGVIVGRNLNLFESVYAEEYCLQRGDSRNLVLFVDNLRRMQDFCATRGVAFALVITPSKAAVYPEDLPPAWQARRRPEPRYYDLLLPLLNQSDIRYVDGHRITAALRPTATTPVFPRGGTHWSDPAALATANALLDELARQGLAVRPIQGCIATDSTRPGGQDRDLFNLVNVVSRWSYPTTSITVPPSPPRATARPNLVVVGGSFSRKILQILDASRQFSEADFYFYYRNSKKCWSDGQTFTVGAPTPPINFDADVYAADSLVLECNEQTLHTPAAHLTSFLRDALSGLPDPHAPKTPFHREGQGNLQ